MPWIWWGVAFLTAVVDWFAVARGIRRLRYFFKPLVMVLVIVGAAMVTVAGSGLQRPGFFLAAFGLSLLGDVFLMLPGERWFIPGLGSFLVAHLCFIVGLNPQLPAVASAWLLLPIALVAVVVLRRILAALRESGLSSLHGPVLVYGVVLSLTLFSGWASWWRIDWPVTACLAASIGVTLFFLSDLMLAWERFVQPSRTLRVAVIVTYHLAQMSLAALMALR